MINFMTFRNVVFNASPRLNIILGQNGAGKVGVIEGSRNVYRAQSLAPCAWRWEKIRNCC